MTIAPTAGPVGPAVGAIVISAGLNTPESWPVSQDQKRQDHKR